MIAYVRIFDGQLTREDRLLMMANGAKVQPVEIGIFSPGMKTIDHLEAGDVGYIATGFKTVSECRVGDTITSATNPIKEPLAGYRQAKPMVFAGVYPTRR